MSDSEEESSNVGSPGYAHINTFFECKEGISIGFITIVILGVLTMWYILYTKITMGRRKRDAMPIDDTDEVDFYVFTKAVLLSGRFKVFLNPVMNISSTSFLLSYYIFYKGLCISKV